MTFLRDKIMVSKIISFVKYVFISEKERERERKTSMM